MSTETHEEIEICLPYVDYGDCTVTPEGTEFQKRIGYDATTAYWRYMQNTLPPMKWTPFVKAEYRECKDKRKRRRMKRRGNHLFWFPMFDPVKAKEETTIEEPDDTVYFWNDDWMKVTE